jgi:hypothetical protein
MNLWISSTLMVERVSRFLRAADWRWRNQALAAERQAEPPARARGAISIKGVEGLGGRGSICIGGAGRRDAAALG